MGRWLVVVAVLLMPLAAQAQGVEPEATSTPAYEWMIDWADEVAQKLGVDVCPGRIEVRPAMLAGDEVHAADLLARTLWGLQRQQADESAPPDCVLLVHTPRRLDERWLWRVDVQGTMLGTVELDRKREVDAAVGSARQIHPKRKPTLGLTLSRIGGVVAVGAYAGTAGIALLSAMFFAALGEVPWQVAIAFVPVAGPAIGAASPDLGPPISTILYTSTALQAGGLVLAAIGLGVHANQKKKQRVRLNVGAGGTTGLTLSADF